MDTNEKNRDAARQRRQQQGEQKRSAAVRRNPAEPRRAAAQKNTADRAAAAKRSGQRPDQQRPAQPRSTQPENTQRRSAQPESAQRRSAQQPADPRRAAPQGTGPRKSAPQRSAREQEAARQRAAQQRSAQKKMPKQERSRKQNPLQSFLAGVKNNGQRSADQAEEARLRKQKRAAAAARKRKQAERHDTPAVIYTAPQPFNRNRLLIQLATVTAVVVALVLGLSVFFKVKTITVSGAEVYSAWAVREASGIEEGDNLLTFSRARANAQIYANLSYVEKVRIGIKLPDTVIIYIEEADVAYAIKSGDGDWWLMTSSGKVVEQVDSATAEQHTQLLGVALESPKVGEDAVAVEDLPTETDASGEYIPVTVTGAQRLYSALQILKALEDNDIVGEAASVNVSRLDDIILWYGTRYQVCLGDTSKMERKIQWMNDVILQMSDYQSGILDITFTTWTDQVGYTPFS